MCSQWGSTCLSVMYVLCICLNNYLWFDLELCDNDTALLCAQSHSTLFNQIVQLLKQCIYFVSTVSTQIFAFLFTHIVKVVLWLSHPLLWVTVKPFFMWSLNWDCHLLSRGFFKHWVLDNIIWGTFVWLYRCTWHKQLLATRHGWPTYGAVPIVDGPPSLKMCKKNVFADNRSFFLVKKV